MKKKEKKKNIEKKNNEFLSGWKIYLFITT